MVENKNGMRLIFISIVMLTLLFFLTSCKRQVKDDKANTEFVEDKNRITEAISGNSPEISPKPSVVPYKDILTQNKDTSFTEITRKEAGLDTIPRLDFTKFNLNSRVNELLQQNNYKDTDYAAGIVMPVSPGTNTFIVSDRFSEKIIEEIKIGTDMALVRNTLGQPSMTNNDLIFYKTNNYYIGLKGNAKVEQVIISKNPKEYDKDILLTILNQLTLTTTLDKIIESNKGFFESSGYVNGGGRYANSNNGIEILDFSKDKRITVYNNFEGKLHRDNFKNTGYVITCQNTDSVTGRMESDLSGFNSLNQLFEKEGTLSPSGKHKSVYQWFYSMSQYFTIRSTDNSRPDFRIPAYTSQGQYKWLSDDFILYIHTFEQAPYILAVGKTDQHINVLKELGVLDTSRNKTTPDYEIVEVGTDIFTLKNRKDNSNIKVRFTINEGKIRLEKNS